jgi:hypothetical protein
MELVGMQKTVAAALAIVFIALAVGGTYAILCGQGGYRNDAKVVPTKFWTGPGQGGPESVQLVKWLLGPGTGGPEKVVPCYILMGYSVRNDL